MMSENLWNVYIENPYYKLLTPVQQNHTTRPPTYKNNTKFCAI